MCLSQVLPSLLVQRAYGECEAVKHGHLTANLHIDCGGKKQVSDSRGEHFIRDRKGSVLISILSGWENIYIDCTGKKTGVRHSDGVDDILSEFGFLYYNQVLTPEHCGDFA